MADTLITNLANVASPTGAEELPVNVPGSPDTDGKVVLSALAAYVEGTLGNAAGLDVGATSGTVAAGDDSRFADARTPTAHAASHVNGTDDIQDATASQKGLATAAQITKLDGIEASADVTDAANVAAVLAAADTKSPPIDADVLPFLNSEGSFELAKFTLANLKAFIKTYFDTLYQAAGSYLTSGGALGTPSSGTLTNCTGLPTAGLVDDAVTLAKMAAGTAGNLITFDASGNPAAVATGTAGQVLTSNGAGAAPTMQTPSGGGGKVAQVATTTTSTTASTTVIIPLDNTIPQNTEGLEVITCAITPTNSSSNLLIEASFWCSGSGAIAVILALFRDSTADAIACTFTSITAINYANIVRVKCIVPAASTNATTFKLRIGPNAGTAYFLSAANATSGFFSTADTALMTITEILP